MLEGWKKTEYSRLVDRYQAYRRIVWRLNNEVLPQSLSKSIIGTAGKKLGMLQGNKLIMGNEDEIGLLIDYGIHDCRDQRGNAVSHYRTLSNLDPQSDEHTVIKAMLESFYTLIEVVEVLPQVGVRVWDLWADREYLLIDMGLSKTARKGLVLATRLLPFEGFVSTSGVALPVGARTRGEIEEALLPKYKIAQEGRCTLAEGRRKAADLTAAVIRLCLKGGASERIRYEPIPPEPGRWQGHIGP